MKKIFSILILIAVLLLSAPSSAFAQVGTPPIGGCPVGFEAHMLHEHLGDHEHHIGLIASLNPDNIICVKHLSGGLHVHVDNVVR